MMYRVVVSFSDAMDGGHTYSVGDLFPREGVIAGTERLEELSSNRNRLGVAVIAREDREEGLSEAKEDTLEAKTGVDPSNGPKAKRKPRKGQGKNARADSGLHT